MGQRKTIIELNGKRYNALTGEIISSSPNLARQSHTAPISKIPSTVKVLDGFTKHSKQDPSTKNHLNLSKPAPASARTAAEHVRRHAPERSKTLMRAAVHKPTKTSSNNRLPDTPAIHAQATTHSPLLNNNAIDRVRRAQTIAKSNLISKFNFQASSFIKKTAPLPVKPSPHHPAAVISHVSAPLQVSAPASPDASSFNHALQHAKDHAQTHTKRSRLTSRAVRKLSFKNKTLGVTTTMLAALLIAGFIAYQNMPNLAMRVAAARAGFPATMPSYYPAGFALDGAIQYYPGQITVNFKSDSDDRIFSVTQKPSKWTSETLLDRVVAIDSRPYQTFQDKGKIIYIYDGSNATWVSGGIWYEIVGNSSLTSDQLLRIASSL